MRYLRPWLLPRRIGHFAAHLMHRRIGIEIEERQKIAAHRLEHQRLDRRRERYIRYSAKNRRLRAAQASSSRSQRRTAGRAPERAA